MFITACRSLKNLCRKTQMLHFLSSCATPWRCCAWWRCAKPQPMRSSSSTADLRASLDLMLLADGGLFSAFTHGRVEAVPWNNVAYCTVLRSFFGATCKCQWLYVSWDTVVKNVSLETVWSDNVGSAWSGTVEAYFRYTFGPWYTMRIEHCTSLGHSACLPSLVHLGSCIRATALSMLLDQWQWTQTTGDGGCCLFQDLATLPVSECAWVQACLAVSDAGMEPIVSPLTADANPLPHRRHPLL